MNNEPSAWMHQRLGKYKWDLAWEEPNGSVHDKAPLFTHPSQEWISVKDRLPELHQSVCLINIDKWMNTGGVFDRNKYATGYLAEFGQKYWSCDYQPALELNSFTHWMPLPTPPKEQA